MARSEKRAHLLFTSHHGAHVREIERLVGDLVHRCTELPEYLNDVRGRASLAGRSRLLDAKNECGRGLRVAPT